jgi:hypothetical protein
MMCPFDLKSVHVAHEREGTMKSSLCREEGL